MKGDQVMTIKIRPATQLDAAALLTIYRTYVTDTAITFEYEVPSLAEFRQRIETTLVRYPYIVAEEAGEILGYAYAGTYKGRVAYDWTCEVTVYLDRKKKGRGVGALLYQKLEELLAEQNVINLAACITGDNQQSIAFHEKLGYRSAGRFPHFGYKFNKWHDIVWLVKTIGTPTPSQAPFIPYSEK